MSRTFLMLSVAAVLCFGATPQKSALDKATLEAYVRHVMVYGPQIQISVSDPKPSPLPGFMQVTIHASAGQARQDLLFYVSKDGQKIVQGTVYDVKNNPFKEDLDKLKTDNQPAIGKAGAPVVLVEFTDFQCPYCKQEAQVLRQNLLTAYPNQVRLYFVDHPLEQMHPWAKTAALAGRCVFKQNNDAFWQYHDWMFEHQGEITVDNVKEKILEAVKGKEVDTLQLSRCMESNTTEPELEKEMAMGRALNIESTPTLFINGRRRVGSQDWPTLRTIIDYEIEYQKTAHNAGEDCGCELKLPGVN
jgi:protein-disulfide isomerase